MIWVFLALAALAGYGWGLFIALRECKRAVRDAFDQGAKHGYDQGQKDTLAYLDIPGEVMPS